MQVVGHARTRLNSLNAVRTARELGMGSQANEVRINQVDDPVSKLADRLAMARDSQTLVPRRARAVHSNHGFGEKSEGFSEGNQD